MGLQQKKNVKVNLDYLLDFYKAENVYKIIKRNTKHKAKLLLFEKNYIANISLIIDVLKNKKYKHGSYNIFIINERKLRLIMSEKLGDKIINHLVSYYVLFPILEPKLIDTNVAARKNKGTLYAINKLKIYINKLKTNYDSFYVLKVDITKFFYNIDHKVLLNLLKKDIKDPDLYNLIKEIVKSSENKETRQALKKEIERYRKKIIKSNLNNKEKERRINNLNKIPISEKGKGLPIGNLSSQILAIYYLNTLDHFIKEKLKHKYYVRYMDDFIILHHDKKYLKYTLIEIKKYLKKLKLDINDKTFISEIHNGFIFLGVRFVLDDKRLRLILPQNNKIKIRRKLQNIKGRKNKYNYLMSHYNGYLSFFDENNFLYKNISYKNRQVINHYYRLSDNYNFRIINLCYKDIDVEKINFNIKMLVNKYKVNNIEFIIILLDKLHMKLLLGLNNEEKIPNIKAVHNTILVVIE